MSSRVEPLTRTYVVPLRRAFEAPKYRRTKVAVRVIRDFAKRHMKATQVKLDVDLNELLWSRGIGNPPRRLSLLMDRDEDGLVSIKLAPPPEE
jgi:large subunit ribosomal protein L31e